MFKSTVFTVILLTNILISHVNTKAVASLDIQNLLQTLQQQLQQDPQGGQQKIIKVDDDDDDNGGGVFGSLKQEDVEGQSESEEEKPRKSDRTIAKVQNLAKQVIEQVLQDKNRQKYEARPKKRLEISNLLNNDDVSYNQDIDSEESDESVQEPDLGSLSEYSKVYVVLNSEAVKNSKNLGKLNDLLSGLLSAPPSKNRKTQKKYNGYSVNDELRRSNRDSGETMGKHSMRDDEERPRRPQARGHHGSGGYGRGGSGGHGGGTAVPYLKQHGDIYEKDD